jgi:Helix-turn-helix domain
MSMNPQERIARHRLSVLKLAEALQSVSAACRQRGMTRTQFYDYTRRFALQGLEGLKDLPPKWRLLSRVVPPRGQRGRTNHRSRPAGAPHVRRWRWRTASRATFR